ncbi:tRNA (N6-isopentenyl adenosine(37)-C2)-methylthiotransferase MiaB [bacterium]|nr:tRNA (N6-isopentenyl adenosine(37)-C2)-methylthiotransferase MiaB [bacterium]
MNECDSEVMAGLLVGDGYEMAGDVSSADIILFNTCSVRRHAEDRVWSELGRVGQLKKKRPELILGVCGCMAQKEGVNILNRAPYVDLVCGTYHFGEISRLLDRVRKDGRRIVDVGEKETREEDVGNKDAGKKDVGETDGEKTGIVRGDSKEKEETILSYSTSCSRLPRDGRVKAWVSIMRGCNNYCAYCVVPYLRGRERSRPLDEIVQEIKGLAEEGYKEVTLLGQNVNSYPGFVDLLKGVNKIDGIERIRFVTSHPRDITEEMLRVVSQSEKICEHLHLPLQAGSDKILKRMNRGYTREFYEDLIKKARKLIPGVSITTDLIVGFPGEKEEDFEDTLNLVKELEFDGAFIYKYSHRPGTAAAKMDGGVVEEVKKERLHRLQELQEKISGKKNEGLVNQEVEVLVEGPSKKVPLRLYGRTRTNKIVIFEGVEELVGKLIKVRIKEVGPWTLFGSLN